MSCSAQGCCGFRQRGSTTGDKRLLGLAIDGVPRARDEIFMSYFGAGLSQIAWLLPSAIDGSQPYDATAGVVLSPGPAEGAKIS